MVPDFEKYAIKCGDLRENFSKRFQDLNGRKTQIKLFQRPFSVNVEYIDDADTKLEFLDLSQTKFCMTFSNKNHFLSFTLASKKRSIQFCWEMQKSGFVNLQARTVLNGHSQL